MDINSFKEEFITVCKNFHNTVTSSSVFYFIKEKYDHLSSFSRKAIKTALLLTLSCVLFYYPFSRLYLSWKNMKDFNTKKQLSWELTNVSSSQSIGLSGSYTLSQDPIQFIEKRISTLQIPKNQIKEVKRSNRAQKPKYLPSAFVMNTVEVKMINLNIKEVVQYGYQMEQLSNNIKLMNLYIKENPEKDNYFNVSYILSFFNPTKPLPSNSKEKQTKTKREDIPPILPMRESPKKIPLAPPVPEALKLKNTLFNNLKKRKKSPGLVFQSKKQQEEESSSVRLLDVKKEDNNNNRPTNFYFKNRAKEVKKRDLVPAMPLLQNKKNKPSFLKPPSFSNSKKISEPKEVPPAPLLSPQNKQSTESKPPEPNVNTTIKEKK